MMQLPETIRVAGIDYKVDVSRNDALTVEGIGGECSYMNARISVRDDRPEQIVMQVFVHELLHAILYRAGLEDNEKYNDEALVRPVANVLYQVLRDNDFSWLIE